MKGTRLCPFCFPHDFSTPTSPTFFCIKLQSSHCLLCNSGVLIIIISLYLCRCRCRCWSRHLMAPLLRQVTQRMEQAHHDKHVRQTSSSPLRLFLSFVYFPFSPSSLVMLPLTTIVPPLHIGTSLSFGLLIYKANQQTLHHH